MEMLETEKRGLQTGEAVVEQDVDDAVGGLEFVFSGIWEGEEDLYCDRFLSPTEGARNAWLIKLRQPDSVRPLLDVGVERLRMAA